MLDEHGFGDHGTRAASGGESGAGRPMQNKDGESVHRTILAKSRSRQYCRLVTLHRHVVVVRVIADQLRRKVFEEPHTEYVFRESNVDRRNAGHVAICTGVQLELEPARICSIESRRKCSSKIESRRRHFA